MFVLFVGAKKTTQLPTTNMRPPPADVTNTAKQSGVQEFGQRFPRGYTPIFARDDNLLRRVVFSTFIFRWTLDPYREDLLSNTITYFLTC